MKSKAEQIYEAIGEGYGYNGSKEQCIEIIENILNGEEPASKNFIKPDVSGSFCECKVGRTFTKRLGIKYCDICTKEIEQK